MKRLPAFDTAPHLRAVAGAMAIDPVGTRAAIDKAGGLPNPADPDPDAAAILRTEAAERNAGRPVTAESLMTACGLPVDAWQRLADGGAMAHQIGAHVRAVREADALRRAVVTLTRPDADLSFKRLELARILDPIAEPDGGPVAFVRLADLPPPTPETENPAALFRNGYLRKGGGAILVSPTGNGKSTWTIQAALSWALGRAAFGIEPVRPLTVAIFQTEDDAEEMAFFRDQIAEGLVRFGGWTTADAAAAERVLLFDCCGAVGEGFVSLLRKTLKAHLAIDLVIANPLQAVFGGDLSRNAELSPFLRAGLDPVLKGADGAGRAGLLLVHHTNKPPAAKDRNGWGTDAAAAYIGAGGAELSNWARAVLSMMPVEGTPGLFRLVAGKRGRRLGWIGPDGEPTLTRFIAHTDGLIFWRDADPAEAEAATPKSRKAGNEAEDAAALAEHLRKRACSLTEARSQAEQLFGRARGRRAFDAVKGALHTHLLTMATASKNGVLFIGTAPEAEALARKYGEGDQ